MIALALGCMGMFVVVYLSDWLAMHVVRNPEHRRKLVHVIAGLATIALATYYSLDHIAIMALGMLGVMLLARYRNLLPSLRGVSRRSYGDVFYALGVIIAALFAPDLPTFIGLMLVLTISDTLASLVGQRWTMPNVSNNKKSAIGSVAFFFSALLCLSLAVPSLGYYVLLVAVTLMIVEYVSPFGLDNATIPLVGVIVISSIV